MVDEQAFLAAMKADPANDAAELVYADWLEEHGQTAKAEQIRTAHEPPIWVDWLDSLTPRQEAVLPYFRDKWWRIVTCTAPANRAAAERGAALAYQAVGLDPPKEILWFKSPLAGVKAAMQRRGTHKPARLWTVNCVREEVALHVDRGVEDHVDKGLLCAIAPVVTKIIFDGIVSRDIGASPYVSYTPFGRMPDGGVGQHEGWLAFYDTLRAFGVRCCERLAGRILIAKSAGWWWASRDTCIMTERPKEIEVEVAAARRRTKIVYRDGWEVSGEVSGYGRGIDEQRWVGEVSNNGGWIIDEQSWTGPRGV